MKTTSQPRWQTKALFLAMPILYCIALLDINGTWDAIYQYLVEQGLV